MAPDILNYGTALSPFHHLYLHLLRCVSLYSCLRVSPSILKEAKREILATLVCLFVLLRSTTRIIAGCRSPVSIQPPPTASSAETQKSSKLANHQPAHCPRMRAGAAAEPRNPLYPQKTQPSHPPTHTRTTTSSAQVAGFGSIRLQNTRGKKKN